MSNGYIKLYRVAVDNGWLTNPVLWTFWTYCLLKATHKDMTAIVGNQQIRLSKGQFIFGRRKAKKEIGLSEQQIRTCVDVLKKMENITIKSTNKFSIITVVNWHTYQGRDDENNPQNNPRLTHTQPHTRSKERKNIYTPLFEQFWKAYPKRNGNKVGKQATLKLFLALNEEDHQSLLQATENYANSKTAKDGYAKDPERFLKNEYWKDWLKNTDIEEKPFENY